MSVQKNTKKKVNFKPFFDSIKAFWEALSAIANVLGKIFGVLFMILFFIESIFSALLKKSK